MVRFIFTDKLLSFAALTNAVDYMAVNVTVVWSPINM